MSAPISARRRFLSLLTQGVLMVIGLCLAIPSLGYIGAPLRKRRGHRSSGAGFVDLGPVADLPIGEWRLLPLETVQQDAWEKTRTRHAVWVRRQAGGEPAVAVLSPICPHLGCPIDWHTEQTRFLCPCHGGVFDARGQLQGGPPPRSMDPLEFEVRAGRLWVRWQEFKTGAAERVPVGG